MEIRTARDLGALIRDRRRRTGLTQQQFAARLRSTQAWVSQVENGKGTVPVERILAALALLGITLRASEEAGTDLRSPAARYRPSPDRKTQADRKALPDDKAPPPSPDAGMAGYDIMRAFRPLGKKP